MIAGETSRDHFFGKGDVMKKFRRLSAWLLTILLVASLCILPAAATEPLAIMSETTILFTHDLHSHFLPQSVEDGESGGYARLMTAIKAEKEKYPDALLLDGGDFSIGSLFQTLYTSQAAELRTMGAMGYDATVIGNHEFDHESRGFADMLNAAKSAQMAAMRVLASSSYSDPLVEEYAKEYGPLTFMLPAVLEANYIVSEENPDHDYVQQAMDDYGVQETLLIERGGVKYGIFGLMGIDADECAPTSGFVLEEAETAAKRCVAELEKQGAEFIICLSHAGTGESLPVSEDEVLAEKVDGIDVIISGHTHTTLEKPVVVGDTYIVSAGPYCQNLGSMTLQRISDGSLRLADYRLIPIDETLADDPEIAAMVEQWKTMVGVEYLRPYGLRYDQVLTTTEFALNTPASGVQSGNNLGELVADSFLWAVENLEADAPDVDTVSVTADGVLRANLAVGDITTSQAFDVLSMGVGSDGTSGFPLVAVYLTGRELKAAAEVDASVTPIMPAAQLYMGGIEYGFNTNRMFFNRVVEAQLYRTNLWSEPAPVLGKPGEASDDFTVTHIEKERTGIKDDQLYRVITGMYSAQMLGTVKAKSMGLLSLESKMADGSPVTDFNACILRDKDGNEIKEWYALAAYLEQFDESGIPDWYAEPDGRKNVSHSWNPVELLGNWNWITWVVLAVVLLLILLVVLVIRFIIRRIRRKKNK